ncbi:MAG TPA: aminotransferase class III-fold pyridoxal phosphate-dependent enzyme [Actinomycetota bacterium]|nr:aminotransferase class III-fold pyridoxal phosphate-dependent enzyme [Actinomycetota bacterium]
MSETNVAPPDVPVVRTELPGPRSQALFDRLDPVHMGTLDHREVPFVEARKVDWMIEDVDGNTFADHCSAWGSTPLGATPEAVQRAVTEAQLRYGMEISNYVASEPVVALAERLVEIAPPGLTRISMGVSGTLVVEAGVKLAREATGRPMILSFYGQYHGESTYLTAGMSTDLSEVPTQHAQYVAGLVFAPYPNRFRAPFHSGPGPFDDQWYLDYLEEWVLVHQVEPTQIAGVLIEPVLGEGGILIPSQGFWDRLTDMCKRWGWKLILDEVQTCMGRCGTMFAAERFGLEPDILLLGKGFAGGGQPIAAVLGTEDVMAGSSLHLGGTFAWTPAAAAGALANIDAILDTGALDNAMRLEAIALEELAPAVERHAQVGEVRAAGAFVGIEFVQDAETLRPAPAFHREVHLAAVRRGILGITQWGKWIYRLQPAIDMPEDLFRWSCRQIVDAIDEVAADPPAESASLLDRDGP